MPNGQLSGPILDLSYLMSSSVPEASKKAKPHRRSSRHMASHTEPGKDEAPQSHATDKHKRQEVADATARAAGPNSKHRSASAMAMLISFGGNPAMNWEGMVKNA